MHLTELTVHELQRVAAELRVMLRRQPDAMPSQQDTMVTSPSAARQDEDDRCSISSSSSSETVSGTSASARVQAQPPLLSGLPTTQALGPHAAGQAQAQLQPAEPAGIPGSHHEPGISISNRLHLQLEMGQAGTDEALSLAPGGCLHYRCALWYPMQMLCSRPGCERRHADKAPVTCCSDVPVCQHCKHVSTDNVERCRWHSLPLITQQARLAVVWRCCGQQAGAEAPVYPPGSCVRDLPLAEGVLGRVLIHSAKVWSLHLMALISSM